MGVLISKGNLATQRDPRDLYAKPRWAHKEKMGVCVPRRENSKDANPAEPPTLNFRSPKLWGDTSVIQVPVWAIWYGSLNCLCIYWACGIPKDNGRDILTQQKNGRGQQSRVQEKQLKPLGEASRNRLQFVWMGRPRRGLQMEEPPFTLLCSSVLPALRLGCLGPLR